MKGFQRFFSFSSILLFMLFPLSGIGQQAVNFQATDSNCSTSSPSSGAYQVTICFTSPANNSTLNGDVGVAVKVTVAGTSPGVQRVVFSLNGQYLLTDYQASYGFTLPTAHWADGGYTLSAEALMRDSFTTQPSGLSETFHNGETTAPENNRLFQPSTGTSPANGAPFVVVAGGDGASGEVNADKVVSLISTINPNLFLYLGDVYEKGSISEFYNWYGKDGGNFSKFRAITDPTIGNHEYGTGSASGYFDYWDNIPNYYSFNAGGWHFVSLNSNSRIVGTNPQSGQYRWLETDLAANSKACTVVYYHHPLFNIGPEGPTSAMADIWALMAQYHVTMVLNGHDHDYQRWVPLDANGQPNPSGITEFVAGGSGHGIQTFKTTDNRVAYSNDTNPTGFGVLRFELNSTGANFQYINSSGTVLDSGTVPCVNSGADGNTPAVAITPTPGNGVNADLKPDYLDALDPAGDYQILSDPTPVPTPGPAGDLSFPASADTYVNEANPDLNYGGAVNIRLDAKPDSHAYLQFDVHGLADRPIKHASLILFANTSSPDGVQLQSISEANWGEDKLTYANAPHLVGVLTSSGAISSGTWVMLDVTRYIRGDGSYQFGISTTSLTSISLAARESGAFAPQLILYF